MRLAILFAAVWLLSSAATAASVPEPLQVVAGVRVGHLHLKDPEARVLKVIGIPTKVNEGWMHFGPAVHSTLSPTESRFMVLFDAKLGVQTIRTYDKKYRSKEGAGVGSRVLDLRRIYRTRLKVLVENPRQITLWVKDPRGPMLFYVDPATDRVFALEIS